jgi:hypothetical protein
MCGCAGKYTYTERGAREHSPGYQPEISERSVKIISGKIFRNPNHKVEDGYAYVEHNGRVLVAHFD